MTFKPNIAQLCTIAELSNAKASLATIAKAVGTSPEAFRAWRLSLAGGHGGIAACAPADEATAD